MLTTERLYLEDPWLHRFEARVVSVTEVEKRTLVVLDRTAFYPESGGQMADRGTLGAASVVDVQLDGELVLHIVDGAKPAVGDEIVGCVDAARRRSHMALHTGQHILSRALADVAGYETVSSRLGDTECTIDLDVETCSESALADAEAAANAVIDDDVEVRVLFPTDAELATLPLRKRPPAASRIRVVQIGDFDITPCGGTHCTRAAQVGLVSVSSVERHKRRARLSFTAGPRARLMLTDHDRILRALALSFSSSPAKLTASVEKLRAELDASRSLVKSLGAVAADALTESLEQSAAASDILVATIAGPPSLAHDVARRLVASPNRVVLLAAQLPDATHVVMLRGDAADFDCGAFMKRVAAETQGRGGGRPDRAEGRFPPNLDWPAVAHSLLENN